MKRKRRNRWILLAILCLVLMSGSVQVQAAKYNNMKSTKGITWGLKTNKKYTYYSYWGGVGMIPQSFKITKWRDKASSVKGMRLLTFRITYTRRRKPTAKQLVKAANYYTIKHPEINNTSPNCYYAVVDYDSGMSLEDPANPYGVTVSNSGFKRIKRSTYRIKGYSISISDVRVDVQIRYPARYKGMCIGIGGYTRAFETNSDKLFWDGIYPFWMTDSLRSPKKKKMARFARWYY